MLFLLNNGRPNASAKPTKKRWPSGWPRRSQNNVRVNNRLLTTDAAIMNESGTQLRSGIRLTYEFGAHLASTLGLVEINVQRHADLNE